MNEFTLASRTAFQLVLGLDPYLVEIVLLSLGISLSAVLLATSLALPVGAAVALLRFPGRRLVTVVLNAAMGLPPVIVGLVIYLLLSRSGPLGEAGLLFTPTAMIIAQTVLVFPIIAALTRQTVADLHEELDEQLRSLGSRPWQSMITLLVDGRLRLVTGILAGFGRAIAEVGAVLIVGGNILHSTRTMTTAIVLETSKGNLALALALGVILIAVATAVNAAALALGEVAHRHHG